MTRALAGLAFLLALSAPALAQNNGLPDARQSVVFVKVIAQRGVECDRLEPWQGAALDFQAGREMARFDETEQAEITAEIETIASGMACDDPALVQWTDAAGPNFRAEVLPHYLVGYRALAGLPRPPAEFLAMTDGARDLAEVEAGIAALQAEGGALEGGVTWDEFDARMRNGAADIAAALAGEENTQFSAEEAGRQMRHIARVTLLWLEDQAEDE